MGFEEEPPQEQLSEEEELYAVYVHAMSRSENSVPLKIEDQDCLMQLDTGCALSLAPITFVKQVCQDIKMKSTNVVLSTYTGETVRPLGVAHVKVEYMGSQHTLPIAKESQSYLTINTHIGLFAFKRLPNGIHSGPAIFQRIMDNLLSDIPKTVSLFDDILVSGTDEEDHLCTLSIVLSLVHTCDITT